MAFPATRSLKKLFLGDCSGGAEPIYKQAMRSLDGSDTFRLGLMPPWDGPKATSKWHRSWRIVVCSNWHPSELRYLRPRLRLERVCRGLSDWGDYLWLGGDVDLLTFVTDYNNALVLESEDSGLEYEDPVPEGKGKGKSAVAAAAGEKARGAAIDNDNGVGNVEAESAAPEGESEIAPALREYRAKLAAIAATTAATHKRLLAAAAVKEDVEFVPTDAGIDVAKDATTTADSGTDADAVSESECATIVGVDVTIPVPESASSVAPATIGEEGEDTEVADLKQGITGLEKTIATLRIGRNSIGSERVAAGSKSPPAVATEDPAPETGNQPYREGHPRADVGSKAFVIF